MLDIYSVTADLILKLSIFILDTSSYYILQLLSLLKQIRFNINFFTNKRSTASEKFMENKKLQRKRNLSKKKLCHPPRLNKVCANTGILTMQSMKQTADHVNLYDAGDMADAHALAQCHLNWLATMVDTIKNNFDCSKSSHSTTKLLEITLHLADSFTEDHKNKSERYETEWNS